MSKHLDAGPDGVFINMVTKKGTVTGKVLKNTNGYAVQLQSSTYPLTPKQKESIRNTMRDWYYFNHAGKHDNFFSK